MPALNSTLSNNTTQELYKGSFEPYLAQCDVVLVLGESLASFLGFYVAKTQDCIESSAIESSTQDYTHTSTHTIACVSPLIDMRAPTQAEAITLNTNTNKHTANLSCDVSCTQWQYEIGAELGVAVLLFKALESTLRLSAKDSHIQAFLRDMDMGHIASESALAEEELEMIATLLKGAKSSAIILGASFLAHKDSELIVRLFASLQASTTLSCAFFRIAYVDSNLLESSSLESTSLMSLLESNTLESNLLDSSTIADITHKLDTIPEANGAFVYLASLPFYSEASTLQAIAHTQATHTPQSLSDTPTLCASVGFLQLMRLREKQQATLLVGAASIVCQVTQVPFLKGAVAVLDSARFSWQYPFISAHFARSSNA